MRVFLSTVCGLGLMRGDKQPAEETRRVWIKFPGRPGASVVGRTGQCRRRGAENVLSWGKWTLQNCRGSFSACLRLLIIKWAGQMDAFLRPWAFGTPLETHTKFKALIASQPRNLRWNKKTKSGPQEFSDAVFSNCLQTPLDAHRHSRVADLFHTAPILSRLLKWTAWAN
jgi:hypothetical protein